MAKTRVLLAIDSAQYAQMIAQLAACEAPDLELVYFTDESNKALDPNDNLDLLMAIIDCEPGVVVHATDRAEPNSDLYGWIFGQYPDIQFVHISNVDARIQRIWQSISISEFEDQAKESTARNIARLLDAVRECTGGRRYQVLSAVTHPTSADYVKP